MLKVWTLAIKRDVIWIDVAELEDEHVDVDDFRWILGKVAGGRKSREKTLNGRRNRQQSKIVRVGGDRKDSVILEGDVVLIRIDDLR